MLYCFSRVWSFGFEIRALRRTGVCGKTDDRMRLTIEHCREGRMAYALGEGAFSYVSAGEMKLENGASCSQKLDLPSGHYHGLVVTLDRSRSRSLPNVMAGFSVTPAAILRRFALNGTPKVIACTEQVARIFEEMYRVPGKSTQLPIFRSKYWSCCSRSTA